MSAIFAGVYGLDEVVLSGMGRRVSHGQGFGVCFLHQCVGRLQNEASCWKGQGWWVGHKCVWWAGIEGGWRSAEVWFPVSAGPVVFWVLPNGWWTSEAFRIGGGRVCFFAIFSGLFELFG